MGCGHKLPSHRSRRAKRPSSIAAFGFSGLLVKIGPTTEAYGYFLLPTGVPYNTTSPKLSGRVVLGGP